MISFDLVFLPSKQPKDDLDTLYSWIADRSAARRVADRFVGAPAFDSCLQPDVSHLERGADGVDDLMPGLRLHRLSQRRATIAFAIRGTMPW